MLFDSLLLSNTVNVLIGPNGSGKSRMLRQLTLDSLQAGNHVLAVAPSIYDRFQGIRPRKFKFFGARGGKAAAGRVIQHALNRAYSDDPKILKNLTIALGYTGFDPMVGIRCAWVDLDRFTAIRSSLPDDIAESIHSSLLRWTSRIRHGEGKYAGIILFQLSDYSFAELDALSITEIVRHETLLRKHRIIPKIEYILMRRGAVIPLLAACSGELCFITTVAFIASEIKPGTIIAIDEPETSLHPTWQKSYIKTLLDLFHYYGPKIVISTHSPIIISGAEAASTRVSVFEMKDGDASVFDYANLSLEEMYDRLFDLITPKNHYLSQRAVAMLNELNAGDRNLNQVLHDFEGLREKSYEESQQAVITKFEDMARKLAAMMQRRGR